MRLLLLTRHDADVDLREAGRLEPLVQLALGEPQPAVAEQFARLVELVRDEVENHQLAAGLDDAKRALDGLRRFLGVMQRLAEDREVHRRVVDRRMLQVALPELEVGQAVSPRLGLAEPDDLRRVIHRDDAFAFAREQLAQQPLAGAEVRNDNLRHEPKQQLAKRLPRAARPVHAVEPAGDSVEINEVLIFAPLEDALQVHEVGRVLRDFPCPGGRQLHQLAAVRAVVAGDAVVGVFAVATRLNEAGLLHLAKVHRYAGLAHVRDLGQLPHRQLALVEQRQQPHPGRGGEGAK